MRLCACYIIHVIRIVTYIELYFVHSIRMDDSGRLLDAQEVRRRHRQMQTSASASAAQA